MEEHPATYQTLFLVTGILAIISCIPIPLNFLNYAVAIVVFGLSVYLLVKFSAEKARRKGAILLVIASVLEALFYVALFVAMGSAFKSGTDAQALIKDMSNSQLGSMVGGILIGLVCALASWIVRIVGTVFMFQNYSREKRSATDQFNSQF